VRVATFTFTYTHTLYRGMVLDFPPTCISERRSWGDTGRATRHAGHDHCPRLTTNALEVRFAVRDASRISYR
jgi:hypothetical protein